MVDNRGINPVSTTYFKSGDASGMANKMSDEKYGQGGEYFAQEMEEDDAQSLQQNQYQDRSAQLRASLNGLAMANAGSMMLMKALKEKEKLNKDKKIKENDTKKEKENSQTEEEFVEE